MDRRGPPPPSRPRYSADVRAWAIFAAIAPALAMGVFASAWPDLLEFHVTAPMLALLAAAPLLLRAPRAWSLLALGIALATLAALAVVRLDRARDGAPLHRLASPWVFFDLTREPLPVALPPWISAHGYLHTGSALDEYDVPLGEHPDQSRPPAAILVPFLGHPPSATREAVHQEGPILVARIPADTQDGAIPVTLRGRVRPLPEGLLATLVDLEGDGHGRGVLLDTAAAPDLRAAALASIAALLALLLAAGCFLAARPNDPSA